MSDTITAVSYKNSLGSMDTEGSVTLRKHLGEGPGLDSAELYASVQDRYFILNGILSSESAREPTSVEESIFASLRPLGRVPFGKRHYLALGPILNYSSSTEIDFGEDEVSHDADQRFMVGGQTIYKWQQIKCDARLHFARSWPDGQWDSVSHMVRVVGWFDVGSLELNPTVELRGRQRFDGKERRTLSGNLAVGWNMTPNLRGMASAGGTVDLIHQTPLASASLGLATTPLSGFSASIHFFMGEAYYATPY